MKTTTNKLVIAIALIVVLNSNIFAQGNFTTEWESPTGWEIESYAQLDLSSNVISLIFRETNNSNNVRIYNGATHTLEQSWVLPIIASQHFFISSIYGVQQGSSMFKTKKFDVNGDGVNEIVTFSNFPDLYSYVLNPNSGNILYSSNNTFNLLMDIDEDGYVEIVEITPSDGVKIISTPAHIVSVNDQNEIVKNYELKQNYPNPFNPNTTIEYNLSRSSEVKVIIYDILGKEVSTLVNEKQNFGKYKLNLNGSGLSSGTYFYSLIVDGIADTKKMILVK